MLTPTFVDPILTNIPTLMESDRLILRTPRTGDGVILHEALVESIAELRRFLWFLPWIAEEQTLDSAEIRCRKHQANFVARTDLPYLLIEKSTDKLVGSVGLHRTNWEIPTTEVGFWVRTSAKGKGYVTEGVNTLVKWAFERMLAERIELVTDEGNSASRRVAERCGFQLEGILRNTQRGPDGELRNTCIYARLPATA